MSQHTPDAWIEAEPEQGEWPEPIATDTDAEQSEGEPECDYCREHEGDPMMPPHTPSPYCESGKYNHCTCDACY